MESISVSAFGWWKCWPRSFKKRWKILHYRWHFRRLFENTQRRTFSCCRIQYKNAEQLLDTWWICNNSSKKFLITYWNSVSVILDEILGLPQWFENTFKINSRCRSTKCPALFRIRWSNVQKKRRHIQMVQKWKRLVLVKKLEKFINMYA